MELGSRPRACRSFPEIFNATTTTTHSNGWHSGIYNDAEKIHKRAGKCSPDFSASEYSPIHEPSTYPCTGRLALIPSLPHHRAVRPPSDYRVPCEGATVSESMLFRLPILNLTDCRCLAFAQASCRMSSALQLQIVNAPSSIFGGKITNSCCSYGLALSIIVVWLVGGLLGGLFVCAVCW